MQAPSVRMGSMRGAATLQSAIAMTNPDTLPELRALVGGRYAAVCLRCVRPSAPVPATSAMSAWEQLQQMGWKSFEAPDGLTAAKCPQCAGQPESEPLSLAPHRRRRNR